MDDAGTMFFADMPAEHLRWRDLDHALATHRRLTPGATLEIVAATDSSATIVQRIALLAQDASIPVRFAVKEYDK